MSLGGAANAGSVELDVVGDFTRFERDVKTKGAAAGNGFGQKFSQSFGGTVAKLGGAYIGAQFGRDVIEQASDLEEATNVTGLAFGAARDEVDKLASSANTMFGLTEAQFRQMGAQVGNLFVGAGVAERDAAKLTNSLIQRATDMGSAWNAGTDEVTEAINSGLIGSFEPLRKYGVIIDKATVNQKALEMGLVDANGEITKQGEKLATAQLIMEQTENVAGDFANTSDGVANSAKILGAQWKDMQAQLGAGLLPVLSTLMGIMRQLGPEGMKWVVIGGGIAVVFTKLVGAASAFGKALTLLAANPWVVVALAIVAIGVLIWKNWDTVKEKLGAAFDKIAGGVDWLKGKFGELVDYGRQIGQGLADAFTTAKDAVVGAATGIYDGIVGVLNTVVGFVTDWWRVLIVAFTGPFGVLVNHFVTHFDTIVGIVTGAFGVIQSVIGTAFEVITDIVNVARSIIEPIVVGWFGAMRAQIELVMGAIQTVFSTAWAIMQSVTETATQIIGAAVDALSPVFDAAGAALDLLVAAWDTGWNAMVTVLSTVRDTVVRIVGEIKGAISDAMGPLGDLAGAAGGLGGSVAGFAGKVLGFDTGGVVPGPRGAPRLILAHGGETVLPTHKPGAVGDLAPGAGVAGGDQFNFNGPLMAVDGGSFDPAQLEQYGTELVRVFQREIDRQRRAQGRPRGGIAE